MHVPRRATVLCCTTTKIHHSITPLHVSHNDCSQLTVRNRGQGGTQAVEDAEGLRLFLKPGITREDVPEILRDFDSVRRPRASQIQDNTRKAVERRTAEDVYRFEKYNWTYPGIVEGLRRVKAGEELIQFPEQK